VGRRRARRHADFGDAVFDAAALAHDHRPHGGGDDRFLRDDGRTYPAIHVGRAWFDWFMFPIPNSNGMWPQFRSPLMWDVFAVNTYLMVSSLFWFMGMIPDFAVLRDRSKTRVRKFLFSCSALGWTGSARQWHNYEKAYVVFAAWHAAGVHREFHRRLDFCTAQIAGWHATIFPLYFVIGAVFCGFGMMLVLLIPLRKCAISKTSSRWHIDKVAKLTLGERPDH
jgi:Ni/Fe-hydrogenase subunit HybB-like protein